MTYMKNGVRYMTQDEMERKIKDGNMKLPDRWNGKLEIKNENGKIRLVPTEAFKNGHFMPDSGFAVAETNNEGETTAKAGVATKTIKNGKIWTRGENGKWVKGNHKIPKKSKNIS